MIQKLLSSIKAIAWSVGDILTKAMAMVWHPIGCNAVFVTFMFILGYACSLLVVPATEGAEPYAMALPELFVDIYITAIVLALIPLKARRVVRAVLYVILYSTAVADIFCFVNFGSTLTPTMLLLAFETNGSEASEFLSNYLSADIITSRVGWVLLIMLLHIGVNIAAPMARKYWRSRKFRSEESYESAMTLLRQCAGCVVLWLLATSIMLCAYNKEAMIRLMSYDTIGQVENELTRDDKAELYLPVYRLAFSIYANRLAAKQITQLVEATDKTDVDSCSFTSPDIVLIIGESYNRHHSQLYGYEKETAPRQAEREKRGELTKFSDVVSPWNLTSFVFKYTFSTYAVGDSGEWCDYPLFPELFRKAGYNVTFVTNQFLPQAKEAVYDFSGGFFLNNKKLSKAQFNARNTSLHELDKGVLADLDSLDNHRGQANMTIVHLKGQHMIYRERYPLSHKKWKASAYIHRNLSWRERWILSDYDNATLYNDSIVDEIIKRYEDREAIVIYMPDHGEECYGSDVHIQGRLHSAEISYRLAHEEFEIPFWIWHSEKYAEAHPDIVKQIKESASRPFMTDRIAHMLMYLGGIHCPHYRSDLNLLSDDYDTTRPRILKNSEDYDDLRNEAMPKRLSNEEFFKWHRRMGHMMMIELPNK